MIGGADGIPKVYRVFRQTERRIGDDANLIRRLPPLDGRIFSVAVSADGTRIASGSSLDGRGQVAIDAYEFDTTLPADIQQINSKVATDRSADEQRRLEEYYQSGLRRLARVDIPTAVYAVDFLPDGKSLALAGADGIVRILDAEQGTVLREFVAAPVTPAAVAAGAVGPAQVIRFPDTLPAESWSADAAPVSLAAEPAD